MKKMVKVAAKTMFGGNDSFGNVILVTMMAVVATSALIAMSAWNIHVDGGEINDCESCQWHHWWLWMLCPPDTTRCAQRFAEEETQQPLLDLEESAHLVETRFSLRNNQRSRNNHQ